MTSPTSYSTSSPSTGETDDTSYAMTQAWVWVIVVIVVIIFMFKCCSWCAEQHRESDSRPARSLSTVAIIDSAEPYPVSYPQCTIEGDHPDNGTAQEQPPSYGSLSPPGYQDEPPPPYSSLQLELLTSEEQSTPVSSVVIGCTEDSSTS